MPMHDWSRIHAGTYHNFHHQWLAVIVARLNQGLLPAEFYAMDAGIMLPLEETYQTTWNLLPLVLRERIASGPAGTA